MARKGSDKLSADALVYQKACGRDAHLPRVAELGAAGHANGQLDVGVLGALSRWALAFAPAPGDVNQAGGAVDQTWRAELALGGRL